MKNTPNGHETRGDAPSPTQNKVQEKLQTTHLAAGGVKAVQCERAGLASDMAIRRLR